MARVRLAASAALMVVLLLGAAAWPPPPRSVPMGAAAAVGWPPSEGLVVAEVVTGGASASDEYVELANAGAVPVDLAGLEVVYATSSGATVTRKAAWTASLLVEPGRRVLLANALGIYAAVADATYSGGLAATGGSIVLRPAGGTPDRCRWLGRCPELVRGGYGCACASGRRAPSSATTGHQRQRGGLHVNAAPVAQGLAWEPSPSPSPSSLADAHGRADACTEPHRRADARPDHADADPDAEPLARLEPHPGDHADTSADPHAHARANAHADSHPHADLAARTHTGPDREPGANRVAVAASPAPRPTPTAVPASPISAARDLEDGAAVVVEGTLTTALGGLEGGRTGFVQDATAGIAVYLDAELVPAVPAGSRVRLAGTLDSRYAQRTLRVAAGASSCSAPTRCRHPPPRPRARRANPSKACG